MIFESTNPEPEPTEDTPQETQADTTEESSTSEGSTSKKTIQSGGGSAEATPDRTMPSN